MIDFALIKDNAGNPQLAMDSGGNLLLVQDADCINQMIVCALNLFIGEYEFNNNLGISWVIAMENGNIEIPLLQHQISETINGLNNYINDNNLKIKDAQITNTSFDINRQLILTMSVTLNNGNVLGIDING